MATPCHTRGSVSAASLPLRAQKRTFSETYIAQGNKVALKKVRVTKSVSRPIRALATPIFTGPTFSFSTHYYLLNWGVYETAPMEGVEAADAFTFESYYSSPSGTPSEAVPMEGVEYTDRCQPEQAQSSKDGAARKVVAPKSRRRGGVPDISKEVQAVATSSESDELPAVQEVTPRRSRIPLSLRENITL